MPGKGGDRAFEATNLVDLEVPPGWAPAAEAVRRIGFAALSSTVWCERAKALVREAAGAPEVWRRALRLALRAVRGDPGNREAWTELWQAARALGRDALAAAAMARHGAAGDDSLYWFTRYRMTGDEAHLDRALERLPEYADAYLEKHVVIPMVRGVDGDALDEIRRRFAIARGWWRAPRCSSSRRCIAGRRRDRCPLRTPARRSRRRQTQTMYLAPLMTPVLRRSREQRPDRADEAETPWRDPAARR